MKVLILSCNTGQGHNAAGRAIHERLLERGVQSEFADTLLFASERVSRRVCKTYVDTTTHVPRVFGCAYHIADFISSPNRKSPVYWANRAYRYRLLDHLKTNRVDVVVTPHLFPAQTLTCLRHEGLLTQKFIGVATDYTCIPFWEETRMDSFVIPHPDLMGEFVRKGIPRELLKPLGIPVKKPFLLPRDRLGARKKLGWDADTPTALIMSGSMGYGNVEKLIRMLRAKSGASLRIVVMGGNNEKMKKRLRTVFSGAPEVVILDFTREVPLYMDACDLLFTKPGGLTSTEAAVKNIPLVHTNPIPGCETMNAKFFSQRGMSIYETNVGRQVDAALALMNQNDRMQDMMRAQRSGIPADACDRICDLIVQSGEEASLHKG